MNGSNICVYESDFYALRVNLLDICMLLHWFFRELQMILASFSCFRLLEDGATYVCKLGLHCDQDCYAKLKLQ